MTLLGLENTLSFGPECIQSNAIKQEWQPDLTDIARHPHPQPTDKHNIAASPRHQPGEGVILSPVMGGYVLMIVVVQG